MPEQEHIQSGTRSAGETELFAKATLPMGTVAIVIIGTLLMAAGGVIALFRPAMLASPGEEINGAVHIYAGYLVSRNLAIAGMLAWKLSVKARGPLTTLMVLTALIQLLDAGIDFVEGRWALVPGVLVLGIAFLLGARWIGRKPRPKT